MKDILHAPASRTHAWIALSVTFVLWLGILAGSYLLAEKYLEVKFPLKRAPIAIQLPKFMPVTSSVENQLIADLDHMLAVSVPINQSVEAVLPELIPVNVDLSTQINLITNIRYQAEVPIESVFEMNAPIDHPLVPFDIPIRLPLNFKVPVDITLPINTVVPVDLKTKVIAKINDPIKADLITTLNSNVPLKTKMNTTVVSNAEAHLMLPTAPVELNLDNADLTIAVKDISLVRSALGYPATNRLNPINKQDLVYVYDAKKKPPFWP